MKVRLQVGDLAVSPLCVGMVRDPNVVSEAFERGVNYFCISTDMHWPSYEATRRGLADLLKSRGGIRDDIVIMGQSYQTQPRFCHAPFQELLEAAPWVERIEISAMGGVTHHDFLSRLAAHEEHKLGSVVGVKALAAVFDEPISARMAVNHEMVDLAIVGYRPSERTLRSTVLSKTRASGKTQFFGIAAGSGMPNEQRLTDIGIGPDQWRPKRGDYVRYALSEARIVGIHANVRDLAALEQVTEAIECGPLSAEQVQYLDDLSDLNLGLAELSGRAGVVE